MAASWCNRMVLSSTLPTIGFEGEDSFTYIASDGVTVSPPTRVFIAVDPHPFVISEFMAENVEHDSNPIAADSRGSVFGRTADV